MSRSKKRQGGEQSGYQAFRVTSPAHEPKIIFAAGTWSAVGAYLQWKTANGIGEAAFTIDPTWAKGLTGIARQHIEEACSICREPGIGVCYRADMGWGVGRPEDERDEPLDSTPP